MDPSMNARPNLAPLLENISALNVSKKLSIISELRAESVTDNMACQYAAAGFRQFEVGLQSTNPTALETMNRPTDLKRFVNGVRALQKQGITATIDLIFGLSGDITPNLPFPDLEISFITPGSKDCYICPDNRRLLAKLVLAPPRPLEEIHMLADCVSSPFQIFFSNNALDQHYINQVTAAVSKKNPFVPLELVFISHGFVPDTDAVLNAAAHIRPHFLDLDLQYLYPEPGNRSILFALVSAETTPFFQGPM